MPLKSRGQQVAAIIAEKVKSGKTPATPGMPSTKMSKMAKPALDAFAKLPVIKKVNSNARKQR